MNHDTPPSAATPAPTSSSSTPPPPRPRWRVRPWRLFLGLLIILFGLSLLAQQFGWHWITPEAVWKLWPVTIILIGLSMLFRGHHAGSIAAVVLAVMVIGFFVIGSMGIWSTPAHTQSIAVARETTATAANVELNIGAAKITVRGGASDLASGTYATNNRDLTISRSLNGTTQSVVFDRSSDQGWFFWRGFKSDLNLRLTNDLPVNLTIDSGAADLNLDLTGIQATVVDIQAGASSLDLTLDQLVEHCRVTIDSGAASLRLRLPTALGVRATIDGGASSKQLPPELKKMSEHVYETDGFATASKTVELSIDAGASSIEITRF